MSSVASAHRNIQRWREDPVAFVREVLGAEPDPWQAEILREFPKNRRLAMKASKGVGKTTILAWLCWNFLATRLHTKVVATSITGDNLSDGLWSEMAKWQHAPEAKHGTFLKEAFQWNKQRISSKDHPETWFMSARTWPRGSDTRAQADTLAGLHADNIMFVLDESGGIPDAVMAAAEAALSNDMFKNTDAKIVQAGNPTHLSGPLYRACSSEKHLWYVVEISSDPDNPMRAPRVSKKWAQEQIDKYGRDNPWVLVNVFGQFPPNSLNSLLGVDEVNKAMGKHLGENQFEFAQKRLGVDVARFGSDFSVIFPRQGLASFKPTEMRNARSNDIAARVIMAKEKWGSEVEFVDGTGGYGSGVIDSMIQSGYSPHEIQFSGKAIDSRYYNKRAEMWFMMAEWIKRGGALPNVPELVAELTEPTYTFKNGKFLLEPKDRIKERIGRSCDHADALALTFALPEAASRDTMEYYKQHQQGMTSEYDPFSKERL